MACRELPDQFTIPPSLKASPVQKGVHCSSKYLHKGDISSRPGQYKKNGIIFGRYVCLFFPVILVAVYAVLGK